ncbi:MAG: hypothetical protein HKN47_22570 [Pirellulaceae bacterium]|nr:hypothetical protein [Pirellulaceae bacterium]
MRNMLFALAAFGVLTVTSWVNAESPVSVLVDDVPAAGEGVQVDAQMPAPVADPQPMADQPLEQPVHQDSAIQGEHAPVAQSPSAHVHQHACCCQHRRPAKPQNVFTKLIELERKKNAWLRKTFLNK